MAGKQIKRLQDRISAILGALSPLGLGHWVVHVDIVDEVDGIPGSKAACTCSRHYDEMWLEFQEEWLGEADDEELDGVIIHELLHAAMRDWDQAVISAEHHLAMSHRTAWERELHHAREGLVERLARTINLTLRSNVVQSTK
jgi:hypothetical protein